MPLRKSLCVQTFEDLIDDFLALVYIKIFASVHEVTSIFHIEAVWLANVEEVF